MSLKFVFGDLLTIGDVDIIVHQVNCLCVKAHGLSKTIAIKYPWADIYSKRRAEGHKNLAVLEDRGEPGTVKIFRSPDRLHPDVACFLSQWDFGTVDQNFRNIPHYKDTRENRIIWFKQCLERLKELNVKTVGLPDHIGCGLGGGDWTAYFQIIDNFAKANDIKFTLVRPSFSQKWI
ncbi:unnamed protein product [Mytilus coruscus]|uniref:Macro domain-containing protein n=1 Tax=Mytilus coruscus TaxID=42192 RepID=A0A6J8AIG2_MYTCO|nr:unnamed protein product [Mytilus coruscus]